MKKRVGSTFILSLTVRVTENDMLVILNPG